MQLERNGILVNKKFMEFFFASVLMAMSSSLAIIIDSIIVGNVLGNQELAAMNLIMPLSMCFTALSAIFGIGASICIPSFKGQLKDIEANKCLTLSCIAWAVCSVLVMTLGFFATEPIAAFLAGSSGLENLVADYLKVYLIGSPFTFITMIFPYIIRSDGKPKLASNVLIIANVSNLLLDVVYMKFMGMGLEGGALASICGYALGSALYLIYVFSKGRTLHITKVSVVDFRLYGTMLKMSISSVLGQGFMFTKVWIFNMIIAEVAGDAGLTAFSVCTSCLSFVSMFISGAAQTMMPMVSAFKGAEDSTGIGMTIKKAIKVIVICGLVTTALFEAFPEAVLFIFGVKEGEALAIGVVAVRLFSLALTGIGITFLFMYYMQASGRPAFSLQICALEGFFIIVPAALILAYLFGINGFWMAYTVNEIIVILFIVIRAKHIVAKSEGKLHSVFMLQNSQENISELSVDVFNEDKTAKAVTELTTYLKGSLQLQEHIEGERNVQELLRNIFRLSKQGYLEKTSSKDKNTVDVIVTEKRISLKDMGKNYSQIDGKEGNVAEQNQPLKTAIQDNIDLINQIIKEQGKSISYTHTMMIGMNYTEIRID